MLEGAFFGVTFVALLFAATAVASFAGILLCAGAGTLLAAVLFAAGALLATGVLAAGALLATGVLAAGPVALLETRVADEVLVTLAVSLLLAGAALGAFTTGLAFGLVVAATGAAEDAARSVAFGCLLLAAPLTVLAAAFFAAGGLSAVFLAPDARAGAALAALLATGADFAFGVPAAAFGLTAAATEDLREVLFEPFVGMVPVSLRCCIPYPVEGREGSPVFAKGA